MAQDIAFQAPAAGRGNVPVSQAQPLPTASGSETPLGYAQFTSLSSVTLLTSIPTGATRVLLQAEGQNVRWRDDGTDPTASVGMLIYVGQLVEYTGTLSAIEFIEAAGGAKLNVSYYK